MQKKFHPHLRIGIKSRKLPATGTISIRQYLSQQALNALTNLLIMSSS